MPSSGFPSPFDVPVPPGAEQWRSLYAYSTIFSMTSSVTFCMLAATSA